MPITRTATLVPSSACSPDPPLFTWTRAQGGTIPTTGSVLSAILPGRYDVSVRCATSPTLCTQTQSTFVQCYQSIHIQTAFSALTNITVQSPDGVNIQLNTVSGFTFPYANSDAGVVALKSHLNSWLASNNGTSCEVIFQKSGLGAIAVLSAWTFTSVTTNTGTSPFNVFNCDAQTFSVSATNTSTGPPPVLGQATATPTNCIGPQVFYGWYNGTALANETNPASLTRGITYTVRAICFQTAQWASATVLVT